MDTHAMPAGFTEFVRQFAGRHGGAHYRMETISKADFDAGPPSGSPAVFPLTHGATHDRHAVALVPVPPGTWGSVELHGLPGYEQAVDGWAMVLWRGLIARRLAPGEIVVPVFRVDAMSEGPPESPGPTRLSSTKPETRVGTQGAGVACSS